MKKIEIDKLPKNLAGFFCLNLGRLCYWNQQEEKGDEYFDSAIEMKANISRLNAAKQLFRINNQVAREASVKLLQNIRKTALGYAEASQMLFLNLDLEGYFKEFNQIMEKEQHDIEMLNNALYHKILNEISLLKMIAFDVIADEPSSEKLLRGIIESIEAVVEEIQQKRKKVQIKQFPANQYQTILETISKTAHDISDFVNNEMAAIESEIRFELYDLSQDSPLYQQLNQLLEQVELTQNALNDLKAINEGIKIKPIRFRVKELFEKFTNTPKLHNARIQLQIQNGDAEFYGDEPKIRSFLSELVENTLKHNAEKADLEINIASKDVIELPQHLVKSSKTRTSKMLARKKYLAIIYSDNGKGIPMDKKAWILQPLTTTEEGKGSGLGLFIIKKTLIEMRGYMIETGKNGAKFELYIPYDEEK
jgi:signal transduction histidine kinase